MVNAQAENDIFREGLPAHYALATSDCADSESKLWQIGGTAAAALTYSCLKRDPGGAPETASFMPNARRNTRRGS